MKQICTITDRYEDADPNDLVSFSVMCLPWSGKRFKGLRTVSTRAELEGFLPERHVVAGVADQLTHLGFEVFDPQARFKTPIAIPQPIVSARGRVALFERKFGVQLEKLIRTRMRAGAKSTTSVAIVLGRGSRRPSLKRLTGAARIVLPRPPVSEATVVPPDLGGFSLHLPGDVALVTRASAIHRLRTPTGDRATGAGVTVAVVDSGFSKHPYFRHHGYQITRVAAPDTNHPERDPRGHGTKVLANLLACAPDVHAYGIKATVDRVLAFSVAMSIPGVRVISISFGYRPTEAPADLEFLILFAVLYLGITVVVAAGDGPLPNFPALMDQVIAVGGVHVSPGGKKGVSPESSSFTFGGRRVPDFCGLSSGLLLPNAGPSPDWDISHGTSFAAPQVAGVAALLLQKNQGLTPHQIRSVIKKTATDITFGTSASGHKARHGNDLATGRGLVNALRAWRRV